MTRTRKSNDVPHQHPEAGQPFIDHNIPKYFGKNGFTDQAPDKVKKSGAGRGNWGQFGGEMEDLADYRQFNKPRRRSNSMSHVDNIPSKFEYNEEDPVFEEEVVGKALETVSTTGTDASDTSAKA